MMLQPSHDGQDKSFDNLKSHIAGWSSRPKSAKTIFDIDEKVYGDKVPTIKQKKYDRVIANKSLYAIYDEVSSFVYGLDVPKRLEFNSPEFWAGAAGKAAACVPAGAVLGLTLGIKDSIGFLIPVAQVITEKIPDVPPIPSDLILSGLGAAWSVYDRYRDIGKYDDEVKEKREEINTFFHKLRARHNIPQPIA